MSDLPPSPPELGIVPLQQSGTAWSRMSTLAAGASSSVTGDDFDSGAEDISPNGNAASIDPSRDNYEALTDPSVLPITVYPFLRQVADRYAKQMALELRKMSGALIDVAVIDQVNIRMGNAIAAIPIPSLIGVMQNDSKDTPIFAVADGPMAALFFDLLLGGSQIRPSVSQSVRNFSVIESRLFQIFIDTLATAGIAAFAPIFPLHIKTDRVETNPRFLSIGKAQDSVIKIRFLVQCGPRSGFVDLYLSTRFLAPIEARIRPVETKEIVVSDPLWQSHFQDALLKSHIELWANLSDITIPLYRLRSLKVGDVLPLEKGPQSLIDLIIDQRIMARGHMGRSTGKIAIRIEERVLNQKRDL